MQKLARAFSKCPRCDLSWVWTQRQLWKVRRPKTGITMLCEVEKAEARDAEMLEEAFLSVLALELRQLLGGHLAAIWGEGTVHFAADGEEDFLVGVGCES